jgi:hypothetical protein
MARHVIGRHLIQDTKVQNTLDDALENECHHSQKDRQRHYLVFIISTGLPLCGRPYLGPGDARGNVTHGADLLQHAQHRLVGAAVRGAPQAGAYLVHFSAQSKRFLWERGCI